MGRKRDDEHRLTAGRFARILEIAAPLFADDVVPVEVEYEAGLISQFPITEVELTIEEDFVLRLESKHTDCLARESCGAGPEEEGCGCTVPAGAPAAGRCC
ncbi:MAG: hypothetical protein EXS38_04935 [Opitutus sp.]|nr:hypothetical protein [Opitutus sp.]